MASARRPPAPFDLVVLTGFLGSGKTTLLNRILRDPALAGALVIINEYGPVGLDHLLVEKVDGDMLVMTSGCLCCSIRGDLVATLEDLLRRRDNARIAPFTRVIIETTGLADPAPVLHTVMAHPYLRLRFKLRAVVALVDVLTGAASLARHPEAVRQVALADRLVLTKTDLTGEDDARDISLRREVRAINPAAPIFDAARGEASAAALCGGSSYDPDERGNDAAAWLAAEAVTDHEHRHAHGHGSDPIGNEADRHHPSIRAHSLRYERPVHPAAVSLFLETLRSTHGARLLRLKGLVALADDPDRPTVVHGVQHVMHPPQRLDRWPDDDHATRLVFILQDLAPGVVERLWRAVAGDPQIDEPDLEARARSPLSPAVGGLLG